jgi:SAM-dependent methyltransferase
MNSASQPSPGITIRPCPCCLSAQALPVFANQLASIDGLDMSYMVGTCQSCGFAYAYELPESNVYSKYYTELSKYDFSVTAFKASITDKLRAEATLRICIPHLDPASVIADIGCGMGYLLYNFKSYGFTDLYGIDPAASSPKIAKDLFQLQNVYTGLLCDVESLIPVHDVSLFLLTGVLEHLWSLRGDLELLRALMKPGSLFLIEVPALEHFPLTEDEPYGEFSLEHIQYFSAASLSMLMQVIGLELIHTEIVPLPHGSADSLFGLYQVPFNACAPRSVAQYNACNDVNTLSAYIIQCAERYHSALAHIPMEPFILYGAGSHTCRLLKSLSQQQLQNIICIVDSNPNLLGKYIQSWQVYRPDRLLEHPDVPVVISSYRSQSAISDYISLNWSNPIVHLYVSSPAL